MRRIVVTGNPVDGFAFYGPFEGPFDDGSNAVEWAEAEFHLGDWWVADLHEAQEQA